MAKKTRIQSRNVSFTGHDGGQLAGTLDFPEEIVPLKYAILSHCFTCTRQTLTTSRLSRGLAQAGIACLRFDFTGLGESEGSFVDSHFRSMVKDIECAADFLAQYYQPASLLIGHSMGGTASLSASQCNAKSLSGVEKMVTLASPAFPAHVLHHFGPVMQLLEQGEASEIMVAGRAYPVKPSFIADVRSYDMSKQMQACKIPIMAVSAGNDELIGPEAAQQILELTQGERKLLNIEGADHLFSDREHAADLLSEVLDWVIYK